MVNTLMFHTIERMTSVNDKIKRVLSCSTRSPLGKTRAVVQHWCAKCANFGRKMWDPRGHDKMFPPKILDPIMFSHQTRADKIAEHGGIFSAPARSRLGLISSFGRTLAGDSILSSKQISMPENGKNHRGVDKTEFCDFDDHRKWFAGDRRQDCMPFRGID